jgi:AAA domain
MKVFSHDTAESRMIDEFKRKRVRHLRVEEMFGTLNNICTAGSNESVIAVIGPTGVGKSALLRQFVSGVNAAFEAAMEKDPAMLPAVYLELPTPIAGDANWKDIFIRLLNAMKEPMVDRKIAHALHPDSRRKAMNYSPRGVAEELRRSLLDCVHNRNTKVIVLDEGRNLFYSRSSLRHSLQLDLVKSLSNDIKIPIVIGSSYDLLNTDNFHGQLARRTRILHFERYSEADVVKGNPYGISFRNALYSLLHALPVQWDRDFLKHSDYFLMYSVGCIGILKNWLERSLVDALDLNKPVDAALISKNRFKQKDLRLILDEAKSGEEQLADISEDEFARNFSFSQRPSLTLPVAHPAKSENKPTRSRKKPGVRGPSRDKVGADL